MSPVNVTLRPHDYALEFSVPAHDEVNNDDFCTLLGFKFMLMVFVCMWLDVCMSVYIMLVHGAGHRLQQPVRTRPRKVSAGLCNRHWP